MVTEIISDHTEDLIPRAQLLFPRTSADTRKQNRTMGVENLVKPHLELEHTKASKVPRVLLRDSFVLFFKSA